MLDWHKVCCFVFYETYKIQSGQCGNFTYEHWYQCSIFMFQTEFSQLSYMCRYSIKKRVLWSNKFGKCYSRMICFLSLLSQLEGSWWDNGHKATKQGMFSEVGLLTGGEVMRSVDCLYLAQSWFGVHGWRGAEGFVTRWILKKHAWEIVTQSILFMGWISYLPATTLLWEFHYLRVEKLALSSSKLFLLFYLANSYIAFTWYCSK